MNTMLGGLDFAIVYLDDIIIASRNMEQHTDHIYQVFKRLQDHGFKVKENKCEFFQQRIKYLGYIVHAVSKFHRYLYGKHFILQTDHKPLITILGSKNGLPTFIANQLLRWGTILLIYDFKLEFLSSKQIAHADGLLRLILTQKELLEDSVIATLRIDSEIKTMINNTSANYW